MISADELLRQLANAIIEYRVRGEKDFEPVNVVLLRVDDFLKQD